MIAYEKDFDAIREERAQLEYERDMARFKRLYAEAEKHGDQSRMAQYQQLMDEL